MLYKLTKRLRLLFLLLMFSAVSTFAEEKSVGTFEELKAALTGATDGDKITLTATITLTETVVCNLTSGGSLTLDLQNYSITKGSYFITMNDGVTITTTKSLANHFNTTADGKQVCKSRNGNVYTYTVATAKVKKSSNYFTTIEDAITYTTNSNGFDTSISIIVELLDNVTMTKDVTCNLTAIASLYIKQGSYTLSPDGHKITLRRDVKGASDINNVSELFAISSTDTGCELQPWDGTSTYPYGYQSIYSKDAKVGDTEYDTFANAVNAANGNIITLLRNGVTYTLTSADEQIKVNTTGCNIEGTDHKYSIKVNSPEGYTTEYSYANPVYTYYAAANAIEWTNASGTTTSLYSKFNNSSMSSSGTYKLLRDLSMDGKLITGALASDVTLDLNGHTLTNTAETDAANYCIGLIRSNQKLTIVDNSTEKTGKIVSKNCIFVDKSGNTLNISVPVEVTGDFALATNGSSTTSGTINILEGTDLKSSTLAVYLPGKTDVTISGGTITGTTAIYQKSGSLTISNGTFTGTGAKVDFVHNGNGANPTGDALVVENCGYPGGVPVLSVTGGTFTSTYAQAVASYATGDYEPVSSFISGGTFSSDPTDYVKENCFAIKKGNQYIVAKVQTNNDESSQDIASESYVIVDGEAAITEVTAEEDATSLTIPAEIDGNAVTYIAEDAFSNVENKDAIQSVDLSATTITNVEVSRESGVFAGFPEETLIYMPAGNTAAEGEKNVIIKNNDDKLVCNDFALTDEKSYSVPVEFTATNVTLTRTFTANKTCTVCLPYALPKASANGTFYYFYSVDGNTVKMKEVTDDNLTAYQPYIFMPSADANAIKNTSVNVTIAASASANKGKANEEGTTEFTFTGTIEKKEFTETEINGGIYGFAAEAGHGADEVGQFVKGSSGAYIEGLRAYLVCSANLTETGSAPARSLDDKDSLPEVLNVQLIGADGTVTGIVNAVLTNTTNGAAYNLKGERVDADAKGVVIMNGKKTLVK